MFPLEVVVRTRILVLVAALSVLSSVTLTAESYKQGRGLGRPVTTGPAKMPVKIRDAKPVYPWLGIVNRIEADVILEVTIGVNGRVTDAKVIAFRPVMDGRGRGANPGMLGRGVTPPMPGRGRGRSMIFVLPPSGRGRGIEPAMQGRGMNPRAERYRFVFEMAALDAVKQWRYVPTRLNGEPVPVTTTVTVPFRLNRK
jgi:hypothetical protein